MPARVWPRRLMTAVYWFLALQFALGAITKYWPGETFFGPPYSVQFVEWGYPSWMRFVIGTLEGVSAVLLVIPRRRTRFLGATMLAFVLTGAVTTHIINHDVLSESWAAPTHLVIACVIALANWPADWRDLLRAATPRAATDGVPRPVRR
ncbi:DoxX-like family protein [Nonomuraea solani]|uniref:DoxX-like family protein n=1 Tax=Nonomuraea solani TaxID=1144553 RepID=A0A1H5YKN5_9ACTN|nr:DoxX family protein [Nonomuraea solani]SEG24638.1 DoxX-like family protein [Nonomuraea solani]